MGTEIATKSKDTDTGVIPREWSVLNVGKIGRVVTGKTPPTNNPEYYGDDYPFVKIPDMTDSVYINKTNTRISQKGADYLGKAKIPKNSIMVSCIATIGNVGIASEDSFTNQQINSLIPDKDIADFKYLYYFFKSNKELLESLGGGGSVYTNISKSKFENMPVVLPELPEQKIISEILSSLDDKMELNRRINANLEKLANTLFKQWFVDIGDKLPDSWEVKPLDEIANFLNGLALQKYPAESDDNYLPVIKIRELNSGITDSTDKASSEIPSEYILKNGDVIFSWSGSLDVLIWCNGRGALNQHLFKVTSDRYPKWFYYQWIKHFLPIFQGIASDKAVTMGHIKRGHLTESKVLVPDKQSLLKMDELMSPIIEMVINNSVEIQNLIVMRDSLLPRLMNGKIRVK